MTFWDWVYNISYHGNHYLLWQPLATLISSKQDAIPQQDTALDPDTQLEQTWPANIPNRPSTMNTCSKNSSWNQQANCKTNPSLLLSPLPSSSLPLFSFSPFLWGTRCETKCTATIYWVTHGEDLQIWDHKLPLQKQRVEQQDGKCTSISGQKWYNYFIKFYLCKTLNAE